MPTRKFAVVSETLTSGIVEMVSKGKGKKASNRPPSYIIVRKVGGAGVSDTSFFTRRTLEEARICCAGDDHKYGYEDLSDFLADLEEE